MRYMPPPMAVQRRQKSRLIYVRPRTGSQSPCLWWLSGRQPACIWARQLRHGTDRRTDRAIPKCHTNSNESVLRYDTRCYFNVRSEADVTQLNLPHGTNMEKRKTHISRLATTLLEDEESPRDNHGLACNVAKYSPFQFFFHSQTHQ